MAKVKTACEGLSSTELVDTTEKAQSVNFVLQQCPVPAMQAPLTCLKAAENDGVAVLYPTAFLVAFWTPVAQP